VTEIIVTERALHKLGIRVDVSYTRPAAENITVGGKNLSGVFGSITWTFIDSIPYNTVY